MTGRRRGPQAAGAGDPIVRALRRGRIAGAALAAWALCLFALFATVTNSWEALVR